LLRGSELDEAEDWLHIYGDQSPIATLIQRTFIEESVKDRQAQRAADELHKQELIDAGDHAKRQRKLTQRAIIAAIVLIVISTVTGVFAVIQTNIAQNASIQAATQITQLDVLRGVQLTPVAMMTYLPSESRFVVNDPWLPVAQSFDSVEMVFVPTGCFMMGGTEHYDNLGNIPMACRSITIREALDDPICNAYIVPNGDYSQPIQQQCFDNPFWIDKYEVTQYEFSLRGSMRSYDNIFVGNNLPVDNISASDASNHCMQRNARLPTELEWEYAARGPRSLIYPWGNEFISANVIGLETSNQKTGEVGSLPNSASWIGAHDMSGNVWEWTMTTDVRFTDGYIARGGSWNSNLYYLAAANRDSISVRYLFDGQSRGFRCLQSQTDS